MDRQIAIMSSVTKTIPARSAFGFRLSPLIQRHAGTERYILEDVSFSIPRAAAIGLVGPNGSGKTTLARLIAGLTRPNSGSVLIDGEDPYNLLRKNRKRLSELVAFVPQEQTNALDPLMTVTRALAEPATLRGDHADRSRLERSLDEVGLPADILPRRTGELSTGERQRLALARALMMTPKLLVLDEVTNALDSQTREQVITLLQQKQESLGVALLMIDHDQEVIKRLTNKILRLEHGRVVNEYIHGAAQR